MPDSPDDLTPASVPFPVSDRDRDYLIRTVYGEAGRQTPREQAAVAQSVVNRTLAPGFPDTIGDVVLQNNGRTFQYEPWGSRRGELMALSPDSKAYKDAAQTVDDVLSGSLPDFSGGATHFFAPIAQAALGRSAPKWGQGPGTQVGATRFFAPNGAVDRTSTGEAMPDLSSAPRVTLADAGIAPRLTPSATSQPKAPAMPKASTAAGPAAGDDDLVSAFMGKAPAAAPSVASVVPAVSATPVNVPVSVGIPVSGSGKAAPADDDLVSQFMKPASVAQDGAGAPGKASGSAASPAPAAPPVATPDGLADPKTGELVVAGRPFTDNGADKWSGVLNFANGAVLGAGVPIMAAGAALKEKLTHGGDLGNLYDQARAVYGGQRDQYRAQNPLMAAGTELAGSIPTTVAATMAGGAGLGLAGNALLDAVNGSRLAAPLATAGNFLTGAAGRAVPAMAGAPAQGGNIMLRIASGGTAGAASGAAGGAINTGLTGGDVADNALTGAKIGTLVGGGLPIVGAAARGTFNKLTGSASPEAAALARTAQDYGLPVRAAEISDNPILRGADAALSKVPGMGYGAVNSTKQTALNQAVAGAIGEDATKITPAVMQAAKSRLGATFDRVAAGSTVKLDDTLADNLNTIFGDAAKVLPQGELKPLQSVAQGVAQRFGSVGEMGGDAYLALTRKGSVLDRAMQDANPNTKYYAGQIRSALEGALDRSAPPGLADELRQARGQWRAMKVIEPLIAKDGAGNIAPTDLYRVVSGNTPQMAYGGGGPLADLARVAQAFGPEGASSASAPGGDALGRLAKIGQLAGGAAGAAVGIDRFGPQLNALTNGMAGPALAGTAAGLVGGRLASSALRSNALANSLIDRALGTGNVGPVNRLAQLTSEVAPKTAAPVYNRLTGATNDNDQARLQDFLVQRSAVGGRKPAPPPIGR